MYVGRDFDPAQSGETNAYGFDFVNDLNPAINEVIVGSTWSVAVSQGSDASPSSHLIGGQFLSSPTITSQQIGGLVSGVTYIVMATVVTSAGNTLELWSHIPCIAPF